MREPAISKLGHFITQGTFGIHTHLYEIVGDNAGRESKNARDDPDKKNCVKFRRWQLSRPSHPLYPGTIDTLQVFPEWDKQNLFTPRMYGPAINSRKYGSKVGRRRRGGGVGGNASLLRQTDK